jgi:hypothetical protein
MEQFHALAARNRHLCALSEKIFQQLGVKDDELALELSGMGECSFDHFFAVLQSILDARGYEQISKQDARLIFNVCSPHAEGDGGFGKGGVAGLARDEGLIKSTQGSYPGAMPTEGVVTAPFTTHFTGVGGGDFCGDGGEVFAPSIARKGRETRNSGVPTVSLNALQVCRVLFFSFNVFSSSVTLTCVVYSLSLSLSLARSRSRSRSLARAPLSLWNLRKRAARTIEDFCKTYLIFLGLPWQQVFFQVLSLGFRV